MLLNYIGNEPDGTKTIVSPASGKLLATTFVWPLISFLIIVALFLGCFVTVRKFVF